MGENELETRIDGIVDYCMIHGDGGWAPQMGGLSTVANDKFNGPPQVEIYGMSNHEQFYKQMDLGDGGVLYGPMEQAKAFERWMEKQKRRVLSPTDTAAGHNISTA
ncbi:MAG: hypothetical protein Q9170_001292 [Blastenia crenularia]